MGRAVGSQVATRRELLEAAGELFAEKGYHAAGVREICARAGANVSAVNYHFGGKKRLHEAVLIHVVNDAFSRHPLDWKTLQGSPPKDRLRRLLRDELTRMLDPDRPEWHRRIMMQEAFEPSQAMKRLIERGARKHFEAFRNFVRELAGPGASDETVELCVASIAGQCAYYHVAQKLIPRLYSRVALTSDGLDRIAQHVADFSLAAIEGLADRKRSGE
jgi:AcrR family transcriptional regulator